VVTLCDSTTSVVFMGDRGGGESVNLKPKLMVGGENMAVWCE
jgi:hypothetical protein